MARIGSHAKPLSRQAIKAGTESALSSVFETTAGVRAPIKEGFPTFETATWAMWARKRIDIGWLDLAFGLRGCLLPRDRASLERAVESTWTDENTLVCLSVRTGLDLWLQSSQLPAGSEVLISAVTIPDVAKILQCHGLVPIPIDLDPDDMSPDLDSVADRVTPKTRAVLVAHLFGGITPMQPLIDFAKRNELAVIEDCAQAFDGRYRGHRQSDVVAFSFGPIKTATALGGGVLTIRDPIVLRRMREIQAQYGVQSNGTFARRVLHYGLLKVVGLRPVYDIFVRVNAWLKRDIDEVIGGSARNFCSGDLLDQLRVRPSSALLQLLQRRLQSFDAKRQRHHARLARCWVDVVSESTQCPGASAGRHTYWAVPIQTANTRECVACLRSAGFDATTRSSLCVIPSPSENDRATENASRTTSNMVFVPIYPEMPESEVNRLRDVVMDFVADSNRQIQTTSDDDYRVASEVIGQ